MRETAARAEVDGVLRTLASVARIAREHRQAALVRSAEALACRAQQGHFYLAVVGQFKRGKSTLVNALLRAPVLPTGVVPVTAIITIVEFGHTPSAVVETKDGQEREVPPEMIVDFITEQGNPDNRRDVAAVTVRHPAPLLERGICIVDTPGVGSVFELSSQATHAFVPKIDAALVVLGADPPISANELELVGRIAQQVPDLIFVLNKADLFPEADRREAAAFCARVLVERLRRPMPDIAVVSARRALADPSDPGSGLAAVERQLIDLADRAGSRLVLRAAQRGARRLADELAGVLALERGALLEPLEALATRTEEFRRQSREIERMLEDLDYQLRAEVDKTNRWLNSAAQSFLDNERPALEQQVRERVRPLRDLPRSRLREDAARQVRAVLNERLAAWLKQMEPQVDAHYRRLTDRFVDAANVCAERISEAARQALGLSVDPTPPEPGLRQASRLYYRLEEAALFLDPGSAAMSIVDAFRSRERWLSRMEADSVAHADHFLDTNVARTVNDLSERVEESLRKFQFELRGRLDGAMQTAEAARVRAEELRGAGAAAVAQEVAALDGARAQLEGLREDLASPAPKN